MDRNMETQLNHFIADTIWSRIAGKSSRGDIFSHGSGFGNSYDEWENVLKNIDFAQNPERAKEAADYFLSFYQKMGEKILEDPSFVLDQKDLDQNWEQLLSTEALAVKAIEDTIQHMVEKEPSLKQNLQEYLEAQIKEQIEKGNKALELGYLFTKEPFSPENRAYKKYSFVTGDFQDDLVLQVKQAVVSLTNDSALEDELQWKYNDENNAAIKRLYIEEPKQTDYRLKKVIEEEMKNRELQEAERQRARKEQEGQKKRATEEEGYLDFDLDEDFDHDEPSIPVSEKDLQVYFKDALHTLQEEESEKDPAQYAERFLKMQLLTSQGLISDQASIDAFEKEKERIFHLSPKENVLEALAEKKAELFQKRGETKSDEPMNLEAMDSSASPFSLKRKLDKTEEKIAVEALDHQILALEQLTKGSRAYELIEAKDKSAYPLFQKGMQEYQAAQTPEKQKEKIELFQDILQLHRGDIKLDDPKYVPVADEAEIQEAAFMKAFGNLDCPAGTEQKNYRSSGIELHTQIMDGIKSNLEQLVEEKQQERQQEQVLQENERIFDRPVSKDDLDEEFSPLNVDLALTVNKLATSVRKGAFGEKKDNSREYDKMVQSLSVLLEDPTYKEPTLTQKENIEQAYEVCQEYVLRHKNAKTSEGKNRLNLAKESMKILAEMNPELKERQKSATQSREKISFRDLENGAGRSRDQGGNARREVQKEVRKDRKAERGLN